MNNVSNEHREGIAFLLFRVGQRLCSLPLRHVIEVMRPLPVEPIAGAPTGVSGVAVIRGMPLPVLDLATVLDGADHPATRFITVKTGTHSVALAVASVAGLRHLSIDTVSGIPPLLSEANANAVTAIGTLDSELLVVLNTAHLVPESVWQAISASQESA